MRELTVSPKKEPTGHLSANMHEEQATVRQKPENLDSFLFNKTNKNFDYLKINSLKNLESSKIKLKIKIN